MRHYLANRSSDLTNVNRRNARELHTAQEAEVRKLGSEIKEKFPDVEIKEPTGDFAVIIVPKLISAEEIERECNCKLTPNNTPFVTF